MKKNNQIETKLLTQIKEVLSTFPEYWEEETLLRTKVAEDIRAYNENLIEALLANELIKDTYSITFNSTTIFKVEDFISMLRYKNYWENSYTKYTNEIGLTSEGKYLKYNTDVVLDFPHKDSVLEGGMTKEDEGKQEIYYHNVLAKEEIDTLVTPKILSNIKKFDKEGKHNLLEFKDTDNLILKGNNLIALYTLKKRYAGKIKLIYIDPPYNTQNDEFRYNDKFNKSTWLTFIKNRLEIAKDLLSSDGSIWINIDNNENHYLKVLLDEVFGQENFINEVIWRKKYGIQNDAKFFSTNHDYILVYANNINLYQQNLLPRTAEQDDRYTNRDDDSRGPWKAENLSVGRVTKKDQYSIETPSGRVVYPPEGRSWVMSEKNFLKSVEDNRIWFGEEGNNIPAVKRFLSEIKQGRTASTFWDYSEVGHTDGSKKELNKIFDGQALFQHPKPERLLKQIITLGTTEGDLVLDFFMGSSTTQAVAHKMNRQYIGVEQMDYINEVSVPRLQKVIEGEQGGISKDVDWQGGGSFVYAELHSLNDTYLKNIQGAKDKDSLDKVLEDMKESAYLNFKVDLSRVTIDDEGYQVLTLEEKKNVFIQLLDMNQLYLNYSEIEDTEHSISESVKEFNHSFYQKESDEK